MSAINKIEKYELGTRVHHLSQCGLTTGQIAEKLTEQLKGVDSISQPTVSRWLRRFTKSIQKRAREIADPLLAKHVETTLPNNLEMHQKTIEDYWNRRCHIAKIMDSGEKVEPGPGCPYKGELAELVVCDNQILRRFEVTARWLGIDQTQGTTALDVPIDLDKYRDEEDDECTLDEQQAAGND